MTPEQTATPGREVAARGSRPPTVPMRDRIRAELFLSPSFPPALICVAMFVWFAADEAGFLGTTFLPGTLLVLGLLAVGLFVLPRPRPSRAVLAAVGLLAAYALWSYLSILWSGEQGIAWDGANRTVLYALVFALFALWPLRSAPAAVLLGFFGLGVAVIAGVELLRATSASHWIDYFHEGRLQEPAGYANANVALWFSAFWPCLLFAGRRGVPAALRGLLLGGAGVLASAAILGQSRGWLFVLPVAAIMAIAVVPGRGRTVATLFVLAVGVLLILQPLLHVHEAFDPKAAPGASLSHAVRLTFIMSAGLAAVSYLAAVVEARVHVSVHAARRISAALVAAFALVCAGAVAGYAVVKGDPIGRTADAWREFKKGGSEPSTHGSRFGKGFATYRYDYWRVAWQNFERHPLVGVGVDNFGREYLRHGRSYQTPRYPHSVELRALSETGLIGALLLGAAILAGVWAAVPALRRPDLAGGAAGTGLVVFGYWIIYGTVDWLWEYPGLGGPAFAGLGLAAAVTAGRRGPLPSLQPLLFGSRRIVLAVTLTLPLVVGVGMPWAAERELRKGREAARTDPFAALRRLDRSAALNPLSPVADETAALVELRIGRQGEAQRRFRKALERDPGDPFSHLQLGAIASIEGRQAEALRLVRRAHRLDPRDAVVTESLHILRTGRTLDPERVRRLFRRDIDIRIGPE
jgi:O-antigen ligase/polysaccharide polymerase Wzy-like membrane protein